MGSARVLNKMSSDLNSNKNSKDSMRAFSMNGFGVN